MLHKTLKQKFGYDSFRYGQEEIIQSIINNNDTLVVMPTGGGKSLCYQLPALLKDGTALVISPLIALMKDQVDSLARVGIPSTFINSSLSFEVIRDRIDKLKEDKYKLLYIAPERLESFKFNEILPNLKISFIAVDEAHCISEWGHDFRPAYLSIIQAFEKIVRKPIIALTATATPEVQDDIVKCLDLKSVNRFIRGFDRPNLKYQTIYSYNKIEKIIDILSQNEGGSSIIYCGTRKRVEMFSDGLNSKNIKTIAYHAGLHPDYRKQIQEQFINDKVKVIVATNAFGMGIDKPDVRNVIHCDFTQTLEAYYQEAGRAGRDGNPSNCTLIFNNEDKDLQVFFINTNYPPKNDVEKVYNALYDINNVALGDYSNKPIYLDDASIANRAGVALYSTESIINLFEKYNIIKKSNPQGNAAIRFTATREKILEYRKNTNNKRREVLEALMRYIGSAALSKEIEFDLNRFLIKYRISEQDLITAVNAFELARIMIFRLPNVSSGIVLQLERMNFNLLPIDWEAFYKRKERAFEKLDIVVNYALTKECKRNYILNYFKEEGVIGICGKCSSCSNKKPDISLSSVVMERMKLILNAIAELGERYSKKHIISYLFGEETSKTKELAIENGLFFGKGKKYQPIEIEEALNNAIQYSFISRTHNSAPLELTSNAINLISPKPPLIPKRIKNDSDNDSNKLYKILYDLRQEIAEREKISEYALLSDLTLRILVKEKPTTNEQLYKIEGLNKAFLMRFGKLFLKQIQDFHNPKVKSQPAISTLQKDIIKMVNSEFSLHSIAEKLGCSVGEVAREIELAIESGAKINLDSFVNYSTLKKIKEIIQKKPNLKLMQIRSLLNEDIDFTLLRIIIAVIKNKYQ